MTHHYVPAPASVRWPSDPPCAHCEAPVGAKVHDVPPVDPQAAVFDARMLGEGDELVQPGGVADG